MLWSASVGYYVITTKIKEVRGFFNLNFALKIETGLGSLVPKAWLERANVDDHKKLLLTLFTTKQLRYSLFWLSNAIVHTKIKFSSRISEVLASRSVCSTSMFPGHCV